MYNPFLESSSDNWPGLALDESIEATNTTYNATNSGFVFSWNGGQTADIKGLKLGKTYLIELKPQNQDSIVTEINV